MRQLTSRLLLTAFSSCRLPAAQQGASELAEGRRLLVEASQLVEDIPEFQRLSAAANVAVQLVRLDDLADALGTARLLPKAEGQTHVLGIIASQPAHNGAVGRALALLDSVPDGQNKAAAYELVAERVAESGDLKEALGIAHRISIGYWCHFGGHPVSAWQNSG